MRCPKCGYISFDNVEKCLKCKKKIADTSKLFQGSVLNVVAPVFLNRTIEEEAVDIPVDGDEAVAEEEFEITDPDLDILLEDEKGSTAEVELELESDDDSDLSALDELNDDLSEIEAFSEEEADDETPTLDLGMFDEDEEEDAAAETAAPAFEVPEELADISDLSPPEKSLEPQAAAQEPDIDLDLGDFGDSLEEAGIAAAAASAAKSAQPEKKQEEQKLSLEMDDDLDFNLDLGGLSIHDKSDK